MKRVMFLVLLSGCGYSSRDNEIIGQAKKVVHLTPLICSDYSAVDVSLGVMRNGVGSMSTQDLWFYVEDRNLLAILAKAVETGAIVKVKYDQKRTTWCVPDHWLTNVEILE